jgi:hypothetical protein
MKKISFTKDDKRKFKDWGYIQEDIKQITQLRYRFHNYSDKELTFEEAINKFGRERVLGSIGRAAFHSTGSIPCTSENWGVESNLFR